MCYSPTYFLGTAPSADAPRERGGERERERGREREVKTPTWSKQHPRGVSNTHVGHLSFFTPNSGPTFRNVPKP